MKLAWKDLFKPRYAIIVDIQKSPDCDIENGQFVNRGWSYFPAVSRIPVKRPLSMPFGEFYNRLSSKSTMHFCGSKRTLRNIYGIGSTEAHNLKNARVLAAQ